jgi:dihydrofolate reductase
MAKVRVENFTITADGFGAGPGQRFEEPFGDGMEGLHDWMIAAQEDKAAGKTGIDVDQVGRFEVNIGAHIMGRNLFGPVRGPWPDESWTGWWGDNPPYHTDVFVHTHHARQPQPMDGGTTYYFTDEPVDVVLERALSAANGKDVLVVGGASTIQQYLRAGLIDEMHIVVAPMLAGAGVRLFDNVAEAPGNYKVSKTATSPKSMATHLEIVRR